MNLTIAQEATLKRVGVASKAVANAKRDAFVRARTIAEEEIRGYVAALDHEVRQAFESGISKRRIRLEGLGTSDSKTLDDMLRRTEAAYDVLSAQFDADPLQHRYSFDSKTHLLTISLSGTALQAACHEFDWDVAQVEALGLDRALAEIRVRADGSSYLVATTPFWVEAQGNQHPVVAWVARKENTAEALLWYAEQVSV